MGRTTNGYPSQDPKGAKPMSDPQLDMRTWKPPVQEIIDQKKSGVPPKKPDRPGMKTYYV